MAAPTFLPGQTIIRPGLGIALQNLSLPTTPQQGVVAALFTADWGPLNIPTVLTSYDQVIATFGSTGTIDTAQHAFTGGAFNVLAYRIGTGGGPVAATCVLKDSAATNIVTITAKYAGTRANAAAPGGGLNATIRVNLQDATKKDLVISEGTTQRQIITFAAPGTDDAAALVAAVTASNSVWVSAAKIIVGTGIMAIVTSTALAGGVSPTVTAADYSSGMTAIETLTWNVLVTDTIDATFAIQVLIQAFVDRVRQLDGSYVMGVVAEPSTVALVTRQAHAALLNDPWVVYLGNGFINALGVVFDGYRAGARLAGMIAALPITSSLTHRVVGDGVSVSGPLVTSDINACITNGMLVFSLSSNNQVQVEYGITTLVLPPANYDNGWKKIRRVRTRDYFIASVDQLWSPMIAQTTNDINGQTAFIAAAQSIINKMVATGAFRSGTCFLDPANPPAGDAAWFSITFLDNDSAEHVYLTIGTQF